MGRVCPVAGEDGVSIIVLPDPVVPCLISVVIEEIKAKLVSSE